MRFVSGGDTCLSIFREVYETGALVFPTGASVLEIGCAEADWRSPMHEIRPDLQLTGIDWRRSEGPGTLIRGDVLTHDWPAASFDVIVGISSIEHIGLGHYESDPIDRDGDRHCLERAVTWLRPDGWMYLDVPYGPAYQVVGTSHRVYDDAAIRERLVPEGLTLAARWYTDGTGLVAETALDPAQFNYIAVLLRRSA